MIFYYSPLTKIISFSVDIILLYKFDTNFNGLKEMLALATHSDSRI